MKQDSVLDGAWLCVFEEVILPQGESFSGTCQFFKDSTYVISLQDPDFSEIHGFWEPWPDDEGFSNDTDSPGDGGARFVLGSVYQIREILSGERCLDNTSGSSLQTVLGAAEVTLRNQGQELKGSFKYIRMKSYDTTHPKQAVDGLWRAIRGETRDSDHDNFVAVEYSFEAQRIMGVTSQQWADLKRFAQKK